MEKWEGKAWKLTIGHSTTILYATLNYLYEAVKRGGSWGVATESGLREHRTTSRDAAISGVWWEDGGQYICLHQHCTSVNSDLESIHHYR